MSLRARLTLFFVVIVVLPVAVATAYGWQAVARSSQRQVQAELRREPQSGMTRLRRDPVTYLQKLEELALQLGLPA